MSDKEKMQKIKEATTNLHVFYLGVILKGIKDDFGVNPVPRALEDAAEWWGRQFDGIVESDFNFNFPAVGFSGEAEDSTPDT